MNVKLQLIVENVLKHYLDANIVSEEARNRIAQDVSEIYFSSPMFLVAEGVNEEITNFYEGKKDDN